MPCFVVLTHDHPVLHWDFMLQHGKILRTWRLAQPPDTVGPIDALLLADHRLAYLDYEGPLSGDRGEVRRWDRGEYELIESTVERLIVRLDGERLRSEACLQGQPQSEKWTFLLKSPPV